MAFDWIAKWERDAEEMGVEKFAELNCRHQAIYARSQALKSSRSELDTISHDSMEYGWALGNRIREWGQIITDLILLRTESEFQFGIFITRGKLPPEAAWKCCRKNKVLKAICRTIRERSLEFFKISIAHYFAELDEDVFSWDQFGLGDE